MPRLFVSISLPEIVSDALLQLQSGLDGANWRSQDHFHLTLAFIGEVDRHGLEEAASALESISPPSFELTLKGAGSFGGSKPRAVWLGCGESQNLDHLQEKVGNGLRRADFKLEKRRFIPHVTLAYLKHVPQTDVEAWCAMHGLFSIGPFPVREFHLVESLTGGDASHYETLESYPLSFSK